MDPQISEKSAKTGVKQFPHFWTFFFDCWGPFWVHFGSHFGAKEAMMCQDGPKKDLKSLKVPKSSNCKKCDITIREDNIFWALGGLKTSIRGSRRLSRGTWRGLRPEKRFQKLTLKFRSFWSRSGINLGSRMDPEISPKLAQKWNQIHVNLFIGVFDFYTKTQKTLFLHQ